MELTATCGRGENVVRVRERLKTRLKLFFSKYLLLHSDQFKPKSYLKLIKKYIFSEGEQRGKNQVVHFSQIPTRCDSKL